MSRFVFYTPENNCDFRCVEVPDCRMLNDCHKDADCVNKGAFYKCRCKNGFVGDGKKECNKVSE